MCNALRATYLKGRTLEDHTNNYFCGRSFQPAFRDTDRSRASLALYLFRVKAGSVPAPSGEAVEMPGEGFLGN